MNLPPRRGKFEPQPPLNPCPVTAPRKGKRVVCVVDDDADLGGIEAADSSQAESKGSLFRANVGIFKFIFLVRQPRRKVKICARYNFSRVSLTHLVYFSKIFFYPNPLRFILTRRHCHYAPEAECGSTFGAL